MRKYKTLKKGDRVRVYGTSQTGSIKAGADGKLGTFDCACWGYEDGTGWCNVYIDGAGVSQTFHRSQITPVGKKQHKVVYMPMDEYSRVLHSPKGSVFLARISNEKSSTYPVTCEIKESL